MTVKIEGAKFHQNILERFRLLSEACDPSMRPKASAYATYLCMLEQCAREYNSKGVLHDFSLVEWSNETGVPYGSLYDGLQYLIIQKFVREEIHNGRSVWVLCDVEKLNSPERQQVETGERTSLNYFLVPRVLFKTNILVELVRTSNANAFDLLFGLLNQFRVGLSRKSITSADRVKPVYNMKTLKMKLKKNAKGVRSVLEILSPIFDVHNEGVSMRKQQLWIKQVRFSLKESCLKDSVDDYKVDQLLAKYNQDIIYFLDNNKLSYRPASDLKDIVLSFKQEVIMKVKAVRNEDASFKLRDKWIREVYQSTLVYAEEKIHKMKKHYGRSIIYSLGGYFRTAFRVAAAKHINDIPVGMWFDSELEMHKEFLKQKKEREESLKQKKEHSAITLADLPY